MSDDRSVPGNTSPIVSDGRWRLRDALSQVEEDDERRAIDQHYDRLIDGAGRLRALWLSIERWHAHRKLDRRRLPERGLFLTGSRS